MKKPTGKSGKRSRFVGHSRLAAPPKKLSVRRKRYVALIERTAHRFKLNPELLHTVIRAESAYDPTAISDAGAIGLM